VGLLTAIVLVAGATASVRAQGSPGSGAESADSGYADLARRFGAILMHVDSRDDSTWFDESGNGLHGALVNAPVWHDRGGPGAGLEGYFAFDGSTQHIDVGDATLLDFTGPFTLVWWERSDGGQQVSWAQRLGKGNDPGYMARTSSGRERVVSFTITQGDSADSPDDFVPVGEWIMLMGRYTGSVVELWTIDSNGMALLLDSDAPANPPASQGNHFVYAAQDRSAEGSSMRRWWRGHLAGTLAFDSPLATGDFERLFAAATATTAAPSVEPEPEPTARDVPDVAAVEPRLGPTRGRSRHELIALLGPSSSGVVHLESDGPTHTRVVAELDRAAPSQLHVAIRFGSCAEPGRILTELESVAPGGFVTETSIGVPTTALRLGGFVIMLTIRATSLEFACADLLPDR
jgi:hypothetical protein